MLGLQWNWRQKFSTLLWTPLARWKRLVKAMQHTLFCAKIAKNDLKPTDFLKRNFQWNGGRTLLKSSFWKSVQIQHNVLYLYTKPYLIRNVAYCTLPRSVSSIPCSATFIPPASEFLPPNVIAAAGIQCDILEVRNSLLHILRCHYPHISSTFYLKFWSAETQRSSGP